MGEVPCHDNHTQKNRNTEKWKYLSLVHYCQQSQKLTGGHLSLAGARPAVFSLVMT